MLAYVGRNQNLKDLKAPTLFGPVVIPMHTVHDSGPLRAGTGHLMCDKWTALSGPLSAHEQCGDSLIADKGVSTPFLLSQLTHKPVNLSFTTTHLRN